ncbi:MAG: hypothetical protein Q4E57_07665, partial [Eubacteriales bacterium]|nr:hypothetical protein [Eubacteriales bacterium]
EAPATEAAADEAVSDETWKDIQDVYAALVEARNATVEAYNDDAVQADADIENALTTADDLIKQVGDINREDVSEADAVDLLEAMVSINDIFKASLDAMQPAG